MTPHIQELLRRGRRRGLLIDSNLLVVLIVGASDPGQVGRVKRTEGWLVEDYELLRDLAASFPSVITTPNLLTEASNLLNNAAYGALRDECFARLKLWAERLRERYLPSRNLARDPAFADYGLADAGVVRLAKEGFLVLSTDGPLCARVASEGAAALNFDALRRAVGGRR